MQTIFTTLRRVAIVLLAMLMLAQPARADAVVDEQLALHLLNRLGYGPAPGEVEQVRAMGARAWIERQLMPPPVPAAVDARLREFAEPDVPARERRLLRAIASPRQLEEVLTAFWLGWFAIAAEEGAESLRPHVLGRYAALRAAAVSQSGMRRKSLPDERDALRALTREFISIPSAALERSLQAVWKASGGDQRAVLRALFFSPEFVAPVQRDGKQKDALRFVVSAVRASGVAVENAAPLADFLQRPMGAAERADFAQQLARGRLALALAPPRPHRQASSAPPLRATVGSDRAQGAVAQPGPVLMEAPTPSARAMAAAARSRPADSERLLALLESEAFLRY